MSIIINSFETKDFFTAMSLANLDFKVMTENEPVVLSSRGDLIKIPGHIHFNNSTNKYLGWTSDKYTVISNLDAFDFAEHFYDKVTWIDGGQDLTGRQFLVGELETVDIVREKYTPIISLQNSFNGKHRTLVSFSIRRETCQSHLSFSVPKSKNNILIKHNKKLVDKIDFSNYIINELEAYVKEITKCAQYYSVEELTANEIDKILSALFFTSFDMKDFVVRRINNQKNQFLDAYDKLSFKNTKWGVIIAYANFFTHQVCDSDKKSVKFNDKLKSDVLFNSTKVFDEIITKIEKR